MQKFYRVYVNGEEGKKLYLHPNGQGLHMIKEGQSGASWWKTIRRALNAEKKIFDGNGVIEKVQIGKELT